MPYLELGFSFEIMEVLLWMANNPAPRTYYVEKRNPDELLDFLLENEDRVCLIEDLDRGPIYVSEDYDKPILVLSESRKTCSNWFYYKRRSCP